MDLIKRVVIKVPPIKYTKSVKKRRKGSNKKSLEDVYYLTANLFYSNVHYSIRSLIVNDTKRLLFNYFKDVPKLEKMRLKVIYKRPTTNFDLDNKVYFWQKILLDLLKKPSQKQIDNAKKYGKEIFSLSVIEDDSCKYVDELVSKFEIGEHMLIFEIYGVLKNEQQKLFD